MSYTKRVRLLIPSLLVTCVFVSAVAQQPVKTWPQEQGLRIVTEAQRKLAGLDLYGVFDWLSFGIQGKTIVLKGYASRPLLREEAGRAIKEIGGVDSVENQIEVLPYSSMDDRIRASAYNRIYTHPALSRYNANQGSLARALGPGGPHVALMAGGITNDPPTGYHAIHIIVKNGSVILFGVVLNETDADIAEIMANGTPGAFSVVNEIVAEQPSRVEK
jgi:hyperosmotically inducible protein